MVSYRYCHSHEITYSPRHEIFWCEVHWNMNCKMIASILNMSYETIKNILFSIIAGLLKMEPVIEP